MARTGLLYREEMLLHDAGPSHPERPDRLVAVVKALRERVPGLVNVPFEPASDEDLLRVHSRDHLETLRRTCAAAGIYPDPDIHVVPASWGAACLAAGAGIAACRAVLDDVVDNAFCAVRPPGHHAERDRAMGFCLFNNIAVAARWLLDVAGVARVAILDWDVHHGNGTQEAFFNDPAVYFASLHQHPLYPGTGLASERGTRGTILNVPMEWGSGPRKWLAALDEKIIPEFERFDPDFLLISAGFDAHRLDPLANQELEAETYGEMTRKVLKFANGRLVSMLEGGYNLQALRGGVLSHVLALKDAAA